ncbi:MAG: hypothetical protein M3160_09605, partial [Candidatus Eremiobacteraeota bacterium]|nr:hypothetical protein [Candidatus Eremiobacteraeota bacterium]
RFEITSAGSEATPLDPDAIAAMRELGIDISGHQSKSVTSYLGQRFTFVITLCDRQQERLARFFQAPSGGASGTLTILRSPIRLKSIVTVFAAFEISCGSMSCNL